MLIAFVYLKLVLKTVFKRLIIKNHDEYRSKILHVDRLLNVWHAPLKIMVKARNVILMLDTVTKALSILIQMQKKFRIMFIFIMTFLKTTSVRLESRLSIPSRDSRVSGTVPWDLNSRLRFIIHPRTFLSVWTITIRASDQCASVMQLLSSQGIFSKYFFWAIKACFTRNYYPENLL